MAAATPNFTSSVMRISLSCTRALYRRSSLMACVTRTLLSAAFDILILTGCGHSTFFWLSGVVRISPSPPPDPAVPPPYHRPALRPAPDLCSRRRDRRRSPSLPSSAPRHRRPHPQTSRTRSPPAPASLPVAPPHPPASIPFAPTASQTPDPDRQ